MADTQEEIEATDSDEAQQIIENIEIPVESPDEDIKLNEKVKSVDSGAETTELQLVCFSLEKEEFGVDIHRVQEIIRPVLVTAMPEAPVFVNGVINLRGKVIPIIDLRNRVGLVSREDDKNTRIVVFDHNNKLIGMVVDAVTEVLRVSSAKLEPIPPQASTVGAEFVKGIIRMDSKLILVIDCEKILQM
ncbi:MAG: chemotaxis protein CheW [candidate division Zixibacteria bacterium]|nr:chemotaxis protein CheW [candidate division Zixibacteria bacterium]